MKHKTFLQGRGVAGKSLPGSADGQVLPAVSGPHNNFLRLVVPVFSCWFVSLLTIFRCFVLPKYRHMMTLTYSCYPGLICLFALSAWASSHSLLTFFRLFLILTLYPKSHPIALALCLSAFLIASNFLFISPWFSLFLSLTLYLSFSLYILSRFPSLFLSLLSQAHNISLSAVCFHIGVCLFVLFVCSLCISLHLYIHLVSYFFCCLLSLSLYILFHVSLSLSFYLSPLSLCFSLPLSLYFFSVSLSIFSVSVTLVLSIFLFLLLSLPSHISLTLSLPLHLPHLLPSQALSSAAVCFSFAFWFRLVCFLAL